MDGLERHYDGVAIKAVVATAVANGWTGAALVPAVEQALDDPQIFVFGELLQLPAFSSLPEQLRALVELFAYGTLKEYDPAHHGSLAEHRRQKLRKLSVISLTQERGVVPISYAELAVVAELPVGALLEDLLIECLYDGILTGKLDPQQERFCVESTIVRDVRPTSVPALVSSIQALLSNARSLQVTLREAARQIEEAHDSADLRREVEQQKLQQVCDLLRDRRLAELHKTKATDLSTLQMVQFS
jgi:COP9 signalosome complex subunit 7